MIESVLALCLVFGFVSLLWYTYIRGEAERKLREQDVERVSKLMSDSFKDFLKHIEKLERMQLPKPVTTKDVQSVMSRMGEIVDETLENEIEVEKNKGVEMPSDEWTGYINAETKVAFEDEELTVVE